MFNLMNAIRQKQRTQTVPPADPAETAETAQPPALELAENLRKPADFSAGTELSATIRKNPQPPKSDKPASTLGYMDLSANPQNPQPPGNNQNPDAVLMELLQTLQASPKRLRALLSDDDMRDIAEGQHSRGYLLAYFRLMRSDGHPLADDRPEPTRAPENRPRHIELMKAWKPAHDALINHLMACPTCHAPLGWYCTEGTDLRRAYVNACQSIANPEFNNPSTHNTLEVLAP